MAAHRASDEQQATCPLRGLNLCDGEQLARPRCALTSCLCWLEERAEVAEYHFVAAGAAEERARTAERATQQRWLALAPVVDGGSEGA